MSEFGKTDTALTVIPLRRMGPFTVWRMLRFLLNRLKQGRNE